MYELPEISWQDGKLFSALPDEKPMEWTRPADLAAARLRNLQLPALLSDIDIHCATEMLTMAFRLAPFTTFFPNLKFSGNITQAAQKAFTTFWNFHSRYDDFRVLRAELDDYVVYARRMNKTWSVGTFCVNSGSLTVRLEDLWHATPEECRCLNYNATITHDDIEHGATTESAALPSKKTILRDVAPDARIFLDIATGGGFYITFSPIESE